MAVEESIQNSIQQAQSVPQTTLWVVVIVVFFLAVVFIWWLLTQNKQSQSGAAL